MSHVRRCLTNYFNACQFEISTRLCSCCFSGLFSLLLSFAFFIHFFPFLYGQTLGFSSLLFCFGLTFLRLLLVGAFVSERKKKRKLLCTINNKLLSNDYNPYWIIIPLKKKAVTFSAIFYLPFCLFSLAFYLQKKEMRERKWKKDGHFQWMTFRFISWLLFIVLIVLIRFSWRMRIALCLKLSFIFFLLRFDSSDAQNATEPIVCMCANTLCKRQAAIIFRPKQKRNNEMSWENR